MIKIFRLTKSRRLYIGDETFDRNEAFVVERDVDVFNIKMLYTDNYIIWGFKYDTIQKLNGDSFTSADECEQYLNSTVLNTDLKIFRFIASGENPLTTDFTIYGLEKESPSYDRGRKFLSKYLDPIEQDLIVSKTFRDVRNNNGRLKSLEVDFDFYAEDGSIELSKTEIVKKYNPFEAETEERKRRERQMDYLRASAKDTPIESHIEILLAHYQAEITLYKEGGSLTLNQAMINEDDPNILAILNITMPRNDGQGMTNVIKSIQYQIGAISLEDLNV